jgi:hypothetical protein
MNFFLVFIFFCMHLLRDTVGPLEDYDLVAGEDEVSLKRCHSVCI